jgi:hypothetical protein
MDSPFPVSSKVNIAARLMPRRLVPWPHVAEVAHGPGFEQRVDCPAWDEA